MPYIYRKVRPQRTMGRMYRELHLASRGLERWAARNGLTLQPQKPDSKYLWAEVCRVTAAGVFQLVAYSITTDRFKGKVSIWATPHCIDARS